MTGAMRIPEAAQYLGVSTDTLRQWRQKRIGPQWQGPLGIHSYPYEEFIYLVRHLDEFIEMTGRFLQERKKYREVHGLDGDGVVVEDAFSVLAE